MLLIYNALIIGQVTTAMTIFSVFFFIDNPSSGLGLTIDIVYMEMLGKEHEK